MTMYDLLWKIKFCLWLFFTVIQIFCGNDLSIAILKKHLEVWSFFAVLTIFHASIHAKVWTMSDIFQPPLNSLPATDFNDPTPFSLHRSLKKALKEVKLAPRGQQEHWWSLQQIGSLLWSVVYPAAWNWMAMYNHLSTTVHQGLIQ